MTSHYPDLGSVSDWLKIRFNRWKALSDLGSAYDISMEFLRSFLRRHFVGKPVVRSRTVGCSVSGQGVISCRHISWNDLFQTGGKSGLCFSNRKGTSADDGALIAQLAWPMAERQIGYRKSHLVLSARFSVIRRRVPVLLLNKISWHLSRQSGFFLAVIFDYVESVHGGDNSLVTFKQTLKTFLFKKAYCCGINLDIFST